MKVMSQSLAIAATFITILLLETSTSVNGGAVDCVLSPSQGLIMNYNEMAVLNLKMGAVSLYCPTKAGCISVFGGSSGSST